MRGNWWMTLLAAALAVLSAAAPVAAQSRFEGWSAAIIAADWRDGRGQPIEAFDNARRDLTEAFVHAGFDRDLMTSLSLRPAPDGAVAPGEPLETLRRAAELGASGCFLYFTSHGSPTHMVFGQGRLTPMQMDAFVDGACGSRPTVVVISACFSGAFVPLLSAPNRLIITAARRDRSSFGCAADAVWPYFDGCVLEALPTATDFLALAHAAKACVARREQAEGLSPPSEPQLFVGAQMQLLAPTLRFTRR